MAEKFSVGATVKGGFPVMVVGLIAPAEPDVGYPERYIADFEIKTLKGKDAGFLNLGKSDVAQLLDDVWDQLRD